jgi:hypothetical protein
VTDALHTVGNYASYQPATLTLAQIAAEINAGRPVAAAITWNSWAPTSSSSPGSKATAF